MCVKDIFTKIIFEKCPLYPFQFAILNLESEKKRKLTQKARLPSAPFVFGGKVLGSEPNAPIRSLLLSQGRL